LSATDKEENEWNKTVGSWNNHYIEDPVNIFRLSPRLYISSCIFKKQNSQFIQPLDEALYSTSLQRTLTKATFYFVQKFHCSIVRQSGQKPELFS